SAINRLGFELDWSDGTIQGLVGRFEHYGHWMHWRGRARRADEQPLAGCQTMPVVVTRTLFDSRSLAVKQCPGDDDGRPVASCASHRDPAFALASSACESGRLVGAASSDSALASDPTYVSTLGNEFSYVTPENAMKWGSLQPVDAT